MGIKAALKRIFASPFVRGTCSIFDLAGSGSELSRLADDVRERYDPEMSLEDSWRADAEAMRGDWDRVVGASAKQADLDYLRKSKKLVSKPGAALVVHTYEIPPRIQARITRALQQARRQTRR